MKECPYNKIKFRQTTFLLQVSSFISKQRIIQSAFLWLISVRIKVLVEKLLSGFEHESFEMHGVVLVTTVIGPPGI